jgi:hypothetical protein
VDIIELGSMGQRNWQQSQKKTYNAKEKARKSKEKISTDDLKNAAKDAEKLKRKRKRLTMDWFFRPKDD